MKLNASSNSGAIWCISNFQQPCILKMAGLRAKHTPKYVHLDKQIVKAPGLLVDIQGCQNSQIHRMILE